MVAAWINADTGVGPAIASGSHVWSGNWPLLPMMPISNASAQTNMNVEPAEPDSAASLTATMSNDPVPVTRSTRKKVMMTPISSPTSPVRVVRNALSAAFEFSFSSHQCPISMNEQTPTSSHPTRSCNVLSATTSSNIDDVNRLSAAKK
jgi:hypothetical protein